MDRREWGPSMLREKHQSGRRRSKRNFETRGAATFPYARFRPRKGKETPPRRKGVGGGGEEAEKESWVSPFFVVLGHIDKASKKKRSGGVHGKNLTRRREGIAD